MDDKHIDEWSGFSMAKILLSNVLPNSVYDPCTDEALGGTPDHRPTPGEARRREEDTQ